MNRKKQKVWYGIWVFGDNGKGEWFAPYGDCAVGQSVLAFTSVKRARYVARQEWGYDSYKKLRRDGWAEVRTL